MFAVAAIALGCSKPEEAGSPDGDPKSSTAGNSTASGDSAKVKNQIPEELRHAGYDYAGFALDKPITMKVVYSSRPDPISGEQTVSFLGVKDGVASYRVERSGTLSSLGTDEYSIEKDGVYATSSSIGKLEKKSLELPANLAPGEKWSNDSKLTTPDGKVVEIKSNYAALGEESIKVGAGDFTAMKITTTGTMKLDSQVMDVSTTSWYVRNVGLVKQSMKMKSKDGSSQTIEVEATSL